MGENRKWPFESSSRPEGTPLPSDSGGFSIETTSMRLKSLKLQRQQADLATLQRAEPGKDLERKSPAVKSVWDKPDDPTPAGRVRHDDRGMAVWEMAVATGEFATLSGTNILKKLDSAGLSIEETQRSMKPLEPKARDAGGGSDPYNQARSDRPRGAAAIRRESAGRGGDNESTDKANSVLNQLLGKKR